VILFFMHVRYNTRLTWVFVAAGFIWFLILVDLSLSDYLTRGVVRGTYPNSFEVRQSPPSTPRPVQSIPKRETSETK
ncbi:MAG TPA: oxidase, partial [Candidatus Dormibacteraeota bacterium]|nr:oxidase [Candidatus Dormibacteraeota bacterium]